MLRSVIFCPDNELGALLERSLLENRIVGVTRQGNYPTAPELERIVQEVAPQLFFLSLEHQPNFLAAAGAIEEKAPGVPIVGITRSPDPATLQTMLHGGAREYLCPPFDPDQLREALLRITRLWARKALSSRACDRVYSFLPSKPGVGTSTVALNLSLALSRMPDTSALLADFDLNSGIVGFMLRLRSQYSVVEAVQHAQELDDQLWSRLIGCALNLDVLPSGRLNPGFRIDPDYLRPLMSFARNNYDVICLDLSGMMENFSIELLRESGRIFLVCTPEVPSLHLGTQKVKYLREMGLADRVQVLLNRVQKNTVMTQADIEKTLGAPVAGTIPNDYAHVHESLMEGKGVDPASRLGARFEQLARGLMGVAALPGKKKRRFLDYLLPEAPSEPEPAPQ